jgi:hypothetical protein
MSDLNNREITPPTEPIMNIVMYDSYAIVYTTKRSFTLNPSVDENGNLTFLARENANSKGLFCRKGVCVGRSFIYQLTEDGIFRSEGVGNPQSITDGDLHSLFPNNGIKPSNILFFGQTVYAPDFSKPTEMWLSSTDDYVYWRFIDTNNKQVCLIYDTRLEGWVSYDIFIDDKVGGIFKDESESSLDVYIGQVGKVRKYVPLISASAEDNLESKVVPFMDDLGDFRLQKKFYEVVLDVVAGNNLDIIPALNNAIVSQPLVNITIDAIRDITVVNLNQGIGLDGRNIGTLLKWPLDSSTQLFKQSFSYIPLGEIITNRFSDLQIDDIGDKFWQGVIIEADTFAQDKILKFRGDDNFDEAEITINHNGRMVKSYSFEQPFISHKIRRYSEDGIEWISYQEEYVFDKEPELGDVWESQFTTYGLNGFKQCKFPTIVVASTDVVRFILNLDGEELEYELASTGGEKGVIDFHIDARKWKLIKIRLESDEKFRLYKNDCELWIKEWNGQNDFQVIKPFGAEDNVTRVQI